MAKKVLTDKMIAEIKAFTLRSKTYDWFTPRFYPEWEPSELKAAMQDYRTEEMRKQRLKEKAVSGGRVKDVEYLKAMQVDFGKN